MADNLSPRDRVKAMRAVRSENTTPERVVRSALHGMGYRFRLHRKDLPGSPDIVLPRHDTVVFVHGCFWHRHRCKRGRRTTATNTEFWVKKLRRNVDRDRRVRRELSSIGWRVLVVWECQTRNAEALHERLASFLEGE